MTIREYADGESVLFREGPTEAPAKFKVVSARYENERWIYKIINENGVGFNSVPEDSLAPSPPSVQ